MKAWVGLTIVLVLAVGVGLAGPASAQDGSQGRIAFCSRGGDDFDIYIMDPDGSDVQQITDDDAHDLYPAWSPDGESIFFAQLKPDGQSLISSLHVMAADGSDARQLVDQTWQQVGSIVLAPDGTRLAFGAGSVDDIALYLVNDDGSGLSRLTQIAAHGSDWSPAWSPDGSQIVFVGPEERYQLSLVDVASGAVTTLDIDWANLYTPVWEPGGERLAYASSDGFFIITPGADGTPVEEVAYGEPYLLGWSPDGAAIAAMRDDDGYTLWLYNVPSGVLASQLADDRTFDSVGPLVWSPDSGAVAFMARAEREDDYEIYVFVVRTGELRQITDNDVDDVYPAWSPVP